MTEGGYVRKWDWESFQWRIEKLKGNGINVNVCEPWVSKWVTRSRINYYGTIISDCNHYSISSKGKVYEKDQDLKKCMVRGKREKFEVNESSKSWHSKDLLFKSFHKGEKNFPLACLCGWNVEGEFLIDLRPTSVSLDENGFRTCG